MTKPILRLGRSTFAGVYPVVAVQGKTYDVGELWPLIVVKYDDKMHFGLKSESYRLCPEGFASNLTEFIVLSYWPGHQEPDECWRRAVELISPLEKVEPPF